MNASTTFIAAARARIDTAHKEICGLSSGKRKWEMCVPVNKADSDIVLQAPLDDSKKILDALEIALGALEKAQEFLITDGCEECSAVWEKRYGFKPAREAQQKIEKLLGEK